MTETPLRKSLALRGLFSFSLQVVLRLRGLLLIPVLTRALSPSELGVIGLGNALTSGLAPLLLLGMHTGLPLHLVRLQGRAVRPAVLSVLSFSAVFSVTVTTLLLALVSTGLFGAALSPILPVLLPIGIFAVGLALREVATALPLVRQKLGFIGWITLLMDFGGVIVAILLVLSGFGPYGVLLGVGAMSLLGALIAALYTIRMAEGVWAYDQAFLRATLHTALPVVPLAFGLWTLQSSDYFFVSYYRGDADVAIYGLAYNLASPTLMAIAAMNLTYLPTCVEILRQGRVPFARFMDKSSLAFSIGGIAAVAFATSAGPRFAAWFGGPIYEESGRLLPIVVAAYVLFSLSQLQQFIPGAMTQNMKDSARAHTLAAVANVAANCFLVPRFGLWGAAWSTLGSYALAFFLLTRNVRMILPELRWMNRFTRLAGLTVISTAFSLLMQHQASGVLDALLFGSGAVLVTVGLSVGLGLLDRGDLARLLGFRPFVV